MEDRFAIRMTQEQIRQTLIFALRLNGLDVPDLRLEISAGSSDGFIGASGIAVKMEAVAA